MSRSGKKRRGGGGTKRERRGFGKFFLIAAMVGVVGAAIFGFGLYIAVRTYLHSEKFRALVGEETSKALDAEGEFQPFDWQGKSMYTRSFAARGTEEAFFSRMKAHEIRAKVSLAGVGRGVWEIPSVQIDKFDFVVSDDRLVPEPGDAAGGDAEESSGGNGGGFFSGLIPSVVEIDEVAVKQVNFNVITEGRMVEARGIRAKLKPTSATDGYSVAGESGSLKMSGFPDFTIDDFNLRTGEERLYLDHAALRFYDSGKVQVSGDAALGDRPEVHLNGVLGGLDLAKVLPEDWVKKFKGVVSGKFKLESAADPDAGLVSSGTLELRNGSLEAMPVLKRADALAGTTRFRKLNFTNVEVEFEQGAGRLELGEVLFESSGLGCLKGRMVRSSDGVPDGMYMLGLSPDTIKWIPVGRKQVIEQVFRLGRESAFSQVFPQAAKDEIEMPPAGYRWVVVRIDPNSADPYTADIRRQFIEAGGLAIWAELQGLPDRVVKAAGEVASVAGDQGVDLIGMLAQEGLGSDTIKLTADMIESVGEGLNIEDLFEEGTAIPKSIIDSGVDVINELNPLAPK